MRTRRARKSFEKWSELVEQFDCSNDSMERFCQQQDLAMSTFQRWRSTIRRSKTLGTSETFRVHSSDAPTCNKTHTPGITTTGHHRAGRHFDHVDNPHEGVSMNSDRWTPEQIFVYRHPVDMRKQIDGLASLVSSQLYRDPSDRSLYLLSLIHISEPTRPY